MIWLSIQKTPSNQRTMSANKGIARLIDIYKSTHESVPFRQILFLKRFFIYIFLERGEEKEKEKERNINVQDKYQSVTSHTPTTRNLVHNPGMCPDWELNQWPYGSCNDTQPTDTPVRDRQIILITNIGYLKK